MVQLVELSSSSSPTHVLVYLLSFYPTRFSFSFLLSYVVLSPTLHSSCPLKTSSSQPLPIPKNAPVFLPFSFSFLLLHPRLSLSSRCPRPRRCRRRGFLPQRSCPQTRRQQPPFSVSTARNRVPGHQGTRKGLLRRRLSRPGNHFKASRR